MLRRQLIQSAIDAALMSPVLVRAQQNKSRPVVGALVPGRPPNSSGAPGYFTQIFVQGLRETGYIDGQDVAVEYRFAEAHDERLPALATDLVDRGVDAIVTSSTPGALAAKHATSTIPIVFVVGTDPIETGLVASLARPGGNLTGFTLNSSEMVPKLLDLASELVPRASTIALLVNPLNPTSKIVARGARDAAQVKGMVLSVHNASTADEINVAFASLAQEQTSCLLVEDDPLFVEWHREIAALGLRYVVPVISATSVATGGLWSYATDLSDPFHNAGIYVGRILKGVSLADLPIQRPTSFRLVVNLKVARELDLTVPQSILLRADQFIE
jgi:putative tryptophan/tyrosine transport system substrate-binding protein